VLENLSCGTHFVELSSQISGKSLTFNEELDLRPWWTPTPDRNYLLGPFEGVSFYPSENRVYEMEHSRRNALKNIEKRSLIPRVIYLSIHVASASMKENIEPSGSIIDPRLLAELKVLLERHAAILDSSFREAIELVFGVSGGEKSFEARSSDDTIDWINFAVFLNAWNLNSHEINDGRTWKLVSSLFRNLVSEKLKNAGPMLSSPGNDLPFLVQLVTESLSWHSLIIQSCVRSLQPSSAGKKKK
ncbi:hypothetical protein M569_00338, partial [Genlisea aurea]